MMTADAPALPASQTARETRADWALSALVGLAALVVYAATLTPTVPFWDSGEFIATSYVLGIPHPPGTPLYVLLGRVACLLPLPFSIAVKVNLLSAVPAAVAVALAYLVTVRLAVHLGPPFGRPVGGLWQPAAMARFAGVVAALVTAYSDTFWTNAVEAEVYALSSVVMMGTVYLMLRWRDRRRGSAGPRGADNEVVLVFYLLALSIAFHMGTFIVFIPLALYFLADHYERLGTPRFVASAVLLVVLFFFMGFGRPQLILSMLLVACLLLVNARLAGKTRLVTWLSLAFLLGLSVHAYLLIRAAHHPAINEADPSNLRNFWLTMSRDQYKPGPPWELRASWKDRIDTQFWRYFRVQYDAGARLVLGGSRLDLWAFPFVLGVIGAIRQAKRSFRTFLLIASLVMVTSIGLIWHLNFRAAEVRDRDYFFTGLYQFFAVWIGLGGASLVCFVRDAFAGAFSRGGAAAAAVLLLLLPLGQLRAGWHRHDRSGYYVARDYAYNLLTPLEKDAILFTNGDNDTFPLWYLQEVEGIRRDVRVANLSLLNTDWYIRQLRDEDPKVPISWSNDVIRSVSALWDERQKRIIEVKDQAVAEIVRENHGKRPLYIAVTVADLMGFDEQKRLVIEGLAWRLTPEPATSDVDDEKLAHNLSDVFLWRGLLDARGRLDRSVYKDDNTMNLVLNYAGAFTRLAQVHERRANEATKAGRIDEGLAETRAAIALLERSEAFRSGFSLATVILANLHASLGELSEADSVLTRLILVASRDAHAKQYVPELHLRRGDVRFDSGLRDSALADYEMFAQAFPGEWVGWESRARSLASTGRTSDALALLDEWLRRNPSHALALQMKKLITDGAYTLPPSAQRD